MSEIIADLSAKFPRQSEEIAAWADEYKRQLGASEGDGLEHAYRLTLRDWQHRTPPRPHEIWSNIPRRPSQMIRSIKSDRPRPAAKYPNTFKAKGMRDLSEVEVRASMAGAARWRHEWCALGRPNPCPSGIGDRIAQEQIAAERAGTLHDWAKAEWAKVDEADREEVRRFYRANPDFGALVLAGSRDSDAPAPAFIQKHGEAG